MVESQKQKEEIKEVKINNFPTNIGVNILNKEKFSLYFSLLAILLSFASLIYGLGYLGSPQIISYVEGAYISIDIDETTSNYIINFVVPIEFINNGNKAGVIEEIYLVLDYEGEKYNYIPRRETDLVLFETYGMDANVFTDNYRIFGLNKNEQANKNIAFFDLEQPVFFVPKERPIEFNLDLVTSVNGKLSKLENPFEVKLNENEVNYLIDGNIIFMAKGGFTIKYKITKNNQ